MKKKIIISLSIIGVVAAIVIGGTIAYFSDTETSTGNTFTAGAIDLKIDNESYVTNASGDLVKSEETSWELADLDDGKGKVGGKYLFFNFSDLKPGDLGEDTISLHVNSNDAWACMSIALTSTPDNDITEPELEDDSTPNANSQDGELQNELSFVFWADDGDNVYETGEENKIIAQGTAADLFNGEYWTLADASKNIWTGAGPIAIEGEVNYYIGKAWCYGALALIPQVEADTDPVIRGATGITCDGQPVTNASQTDGITADVTFYAEQARNNAGFLCSQPRTKTLILENKNANWDVISDKTKGTLTYETAGPTFNYTFEATGLTLNQSYSLIYYADFDPRFQTWGGNNPGAVIGTFAADSSGNISVSPTSTNLGMDLPKSPDWNINPTPNYCDNANTYDDYNTCAGAKIWLVPTSNLTSGNILPLNAWNPTTYLFETDLIIYNDTDN